MAELFLSQRLGETRAARMVGGRLAGMWIERDGDGVPAGARVVARLAKRLGARGIGVTAAGEDLLVEPWPAGATEGETRVVEIRRAAWREPGRDRLAKARAVNAAAAPVPDLTARLEAAGHAVERAWPADVAAAWDAAFEAARLGFVPLSSGALSFTPTPAFTAVDVDGDGPGLAAEALSRLAEVVALWGLGGSVVIDLAHVPDRAGRAALAAAFDRAMAGVPFERTAINGFGLMQLVLPRTGPSVLERARLEPAATAAIDLLAAAAREQRAGALRLVARPAVARWIAARPHLLAALARQTGRRVDMAADAGAGEGHVETVAP